MRFIAERSRQPPLPELLDAHGPADAALRAHVEAVGAGAAEGRHLVRADLVERDLPCPVPSHDTAAEPEPKIR